MNRPVYLVVEPIEIIASDLAMNVQEYDPTALVLTALSQQAAVNLLKGHAFARLAFVHANPSGFADTALSKVLDRLGAQVVFTGDAAERQHAGRLVLHRPFSTQTTAALLQRTERVQGV